MPPESSYPNNTRNQVPGHTPFDAETIHPYEFAWGMTPVDVQNDGRLDLY